MGENFDKKYKVWVVFGNGFCFDVWNVFKEWYGIEMIVEFYGVIEGSFVIWNVSRNDFSMGFVGWVGVLYNLFVGWFIVIVEVDYEMELLFRDFKIGFCVWILEGELGELFFLFLVKNVEVRF